MSLCFQTNQDDVSRVRVFNGPMYRTVHSPTTIAQALVQIFLNHSTHFGVCSEDDRKRMGKSKESRGELQLKLSMNLNVPIPLLFNCIYL